MPQDRFDYYPLAQAKEEARMVRERGQVPVDSAAASPDDLSTIQDSQGLALSGGGIRSATFNLGLLQSLAAAGQLKGFDFLSTVSGGGYIGACLGRLYQRSAQENPGQDAAQTARDVERVLASDEAPLIRWLRDHGRYLAPQGMKDRLFAFGIYLRNLLTVHVLLGLLLLWIFMLWGLLRSKLQQGLGVAPFLAENVTALAQGSYSPAWLFAAVGLSASLGCAWAYWMHRYSVTAGWQQRAIALLVLALSAFTLYTGATDGLRSPAGILTNLLWICGLTAGFSLLHSIWAKLVLTQHKAARTATEGSDAGSLQRADVRNQLSRSLAKSLQLLLVLCLFALLDEAALRTFHFLATAPEFGENLLLGGGLTGALLAGLRVFAQAMSTQAGRGRHGGGPRWIRPAINTIGVALLILVAFFWALVAVAYLYPVSSAPAALMHWQSILEPRVLPTLLALGLLNWIANKDLDVLNLSSLHQFYAARLTRAYLGAGNLKRGVPWSTRPAASPDLKRVDEVVPGDDMLWADYQPHKNGGPLHLVNVTVNQTQFIADSDFQPDRKGWNLGVGPAGFNLGRSVWHLPGWSHCEPTRLGTWIAASGAAFSTGAGARTGLGFSALLGLLGVRLGYWWRAGDNQHPRSDPSLLKALWGEVTGQFNPDQSHYWYLSDGGHFENCAAYELIRRRLRRIVITDCGADPEYGFEDLANLALKVRLDFGAELTLLGAEDLDLTWQGQPELRALFAEPSQIDDRSGPGLLLAKVTYPDDQVSSWLVIVKPRLPARLPLDLANYALISASFPQQTTLDQFFDESQWESTRKLGRLQGEQLASVLLALPGWQDSKAVAAQEIIGATWRQAAEEVPEAAAGAASPLKFYAPLAIALWTGFEFYSNYQQQASKQAEENRQKQESKAAEITKLALARIDRLEQEVFGAQGCRNALQQCPTLPTHVELVRQMVTDNNPPSSKLLVEMLDIVLSSAGAGKSNPDPAQIESSAGSSLPTAPAGLDIKQSDKDKALVYVQIYDEDSRPEASALIERLRQAGISRNGTPGIENVRRTAAARQLKPPVAFERDTVLYFHDQDQALAQWIGGQIDPAHPPGVQLRQLSGYGTVRKGQIEVWLSPARP